MSIFKTSREKRLWTYVLLVWIAIYSSLFWGRPLVDYLFNNNMAAIVFLTGMLLTGITIVLYGISTKPRKREIVVWIGLAAVYLMFLLRLGLAERSHVIEYSVLAIFIHQAMIERYHSSARIFIPTMIGFLIAITIGVADEFIQKLIPDRVFDPVDIIFNSLAVTMAIGGSMLLYWIKGNFRKSK